MISQKNPVIKQATRLNFRRERPRAGGCLVCSHELIYLPTASPEQCLICGRNHVTQVKCPNDHYICDDCHAKDILQKVEALLISSCETSPVRLAQRIFELPGLNMHGPEYHSIVPAVLIAAYQNLTGMRSIPDIREAIRRGQETKGGSCGYHGSCGAGVGAGVAVSIIEKATPMTGPERGAANRATAHALLAISDHAGPRCCKRDAITSIRSLIDSTAYFEISSDSGYKCRQHIRNKSCIGQACPYFPDLKG